MDLKGIQYFVHVVDVGSITVAARDLGIVQPALSRHIQRIEEDVGARLLSRLPRGVQLTAAGRVFVEHCRRIIREVALAQAALSVSNSDSSGHVTVGIPRTVAAILVPNLIEKMRDRLPRVTLTIAERTSQLLYGDLLAGHLDIAVINNPPTSRAVHLVSLTNEAIVVLTAPQLRSIRKFYTLEELAKTPVVVTKGIRAIVDQQISAHGKLLNVEYEIGSLEGIRRLLLRSSGVTLAPISTFRDDIAAGQLAAFPVGDVNLHRVLSLAYLADDVSPAIQAVASLMQSEMEELAAKGVFSLVPERSAIPRVPARKKTRSAISHAAK